jgi:dolichol kinase
MAGLFTIVTLAIGGGLLLLLLLLKLNVTSLIVLFLFNSFLRSMLNLRNKKSPPNSGGRLVFIIL